MSNTKDNRRVKYTKNALKRSLLSLLKEKPIGKITVKEICELADLNRGTFYSYYSSPAQLLEQIEDEFYVDILSSVASFQHAEDVTGIFTEALTALKERGELSSVLFGKHGDGAFLAKMVDVARDICIYQWGILSPKTSRKTLETTYDFVSYGTMRVVQNWLLTGMQEPPEQVAEFLNTICNNGVLSIL